MSVAVLKPSVGSAARSFLSRPHQLLIGGQWVDGRRARPSPSTTRPPGGHRAGRRGRQGRHRSRRRGGAPRLRERPLAPHAARRAGAADLAARRPARAARRRVRRARVARQRQAGHAAPAMPTSHGSIDMFRYMAGWATKIDGETIPVSHRPGNWSSPTPARAGRRRRPDHPLELPAADGGLEAGAGARRPAARSCSSRPSRRRSPRCASAS